MERKTIQSELSIFSTTLMKRTQKDITYGLIIIKLVK